MDSNLALEKTLLLLCADLAIIVAASPASRRKEDSRVSGKSLFRAAAAAVLVLAAWPAQGADGAITIAVDAREAPRRIFHVVETIPAAEGALALRYPKWIPGEHSPAGPITDLVGLKISRDGRFVAWKRVPTDMWGFTCEVPAGRGPLELAYDYVAPLTSQTTATPRLMILNWWSVIL